MNAAQSARPEVEARTAAPGAQRNRTTTRRPIAEHLLLIIITFQGLSGVAGGWGLVGDPTGSSLHIPLEWLEGSPFGNYFVPGLVLLTALGVFPLVVVTALWRRARWALPAALIVGSMLLVWLAVEIAIIGYVSEPPFQAIYALVGAAIVALAMAATARADNHRPRG